MTASATQAPAGLTTRGILVRRYTARLIDLMLLAMVGVLLLSIGRAKIPWIAQHYTAAELSLYTALWIGYGAAFEASSWQATPGKRWMGLKVYDAYGKRMPAIQSTARTLVKDGPFLALQAIPNGLFISWALIAAHILVVQRRPVHRAIHDLISRTWVAVPGENPLEEWAADHIER